MTADGLLSRSAERQDGKAWKQSSLAQLRDRPPAVGWQTSEASDQQPLKEASTKADLLVAGVYTGTGLARPTMPPGAASRRTYIHAPSSLQLHHCTIAPLHTPTEISPWPGKQDVGTCAARGPSLAARCHI